MNLSRKSWLTAFLALAAAGSVHAASLTFIDTLDGAPGNWQRTVRVPKFDPAWGMLYSIDVDFVGKLTGGVSFENREPVAQPIDITIKSTLFLLRPNGTALTISEPRFMLSTIAAPFDAAEDYAGPSGESIALDSDSASPYYLLPGTSDFDLYVGDGLLELRVVSNTVSSAVGPTDWVYALNSLTGAEWHVKYIYAPAPEPATGLLLIAGLLARRRLSR